MSTPQAAAPMVQLPPVADRPVEESAQKSATHWGWTPYITINNMGPHPGLRSLLGYGDTRWTEFKRCTPYPFGNIAWEEVDLSEVVTTGVDGLVRGGPLPMVEHVKYAAQQVKELADSYADLHGFRILTPLTGINPDARGMELVGDIFLVVQPLQFALHEMEYEFTTGFEQRLADSKLANKVQAREVARICLSGARSALTTARREYDALIQSMSDAMAGKPGLTNPSPFHEWICEQLNQPVPKRIDRTQTPQGITANDLKDVFNQEQRIRELEQRFAQQAQPAAEAVETNQ